MKTVATLLVGVAIGALAVILVRPLLLPGGAEMAPQCQGLVKLSRAGNSIDVKPENICLHPGRRLTWEVTGAPGDKVEIDFDVPDKPFEHQPGANPHSSRPGHYETTGSAEIDSNPAKTKGRWKYTVKWTPQGGTAISRDPVVCIRGDN